LLFDLTNPKTNDSTINLEKLDGLKYKNNNLAILGISEKDSIENKIEKLAKEFKLSQSIIILVDDFIDFESPYLYAWYILNNIDPKHDCKFNNETLFINACSKSRL
jgi:hypothetical protein